MNSVAAVPAAASVAIMPKPVSSAPMNLGTGASVAGQGEDPNATPLSSSLVRQQSDSSAAEVSIRN